MGTAAKRGRQLCTADRVRPKRESVGDEPFEFAEGDAISELKTTEDVQGTPGPMPDDLYDGIVAERRSVWDYYGLVGFSEDGYPQSRAPLDRNKVVEHPMHGAYLLVEYINEYIRRGRDKAYLAKVVGLARAAVRRMERRGEALCFPYRAGSGITPYAYDLVSGLTQANYLEAFLRLAQYVDDDDGLLEAAARVFAAFLIPVDKHGVLLRNRWGTFLEEYPTEVPTCVLNGWLTTLNVIFQYGYATKNGAALALARESAASLVDMLPMFDMPEMRMSRYKLAGFVPNKLTFLNGPAPEVTGVEIRTAGEMLSRLT